MLTDWLDAGPPARVWLDARENDPVVFWTHLLAALDTAVPGVAGPAPFFCSRPGRRRPATSPARR